MAAGGYFSHDSWDGTSYVDRIKRFFNPRGYRYWSVGENLLWVSPSANAEDVVERWLASPTHRAVILSPGWRVVGVGVVGANRGHGIYSGGPVELVTADFGARC
jgi:uncharacterized protein YkwD